MIKITNLTKKYGVESLFENINLTIHKGDKIAVIGQNGSGKSTLIKCVIGEESFDEGKIDIQNNISISFMEQEKTFDSSEKNFWNYLEEKARLIDEDLRETERRLEDSSLYSNEKELEEVLRKHERLLVRNEQAIEINDIRKMLEKADFNLNDFDTQLCKLSGGQKMKLRLVECLVKKADLYILDEPTNHLDFETLRWLDQELTEKETFIIISHDRYLIKRFAKRIIEIRNKTTNIYETNYEGYLSQRAHREAIMGKNHNNVVKKKEKMEESAEKLRKWASVRGSKSKRILAERIERQIEDLPEITNPDDLDNKFELSFKESKRTGNIIFEGTNISKSYNKELFLDADLEVERGEKIAIIGNNGSGKTTLLKILSKEIKTDKGTLITGENVKIGYFDQEFNNLNLDETVFEFFIKNFPYLNQERLISLSTKYGLPKDTFRQRIKTLSGGEKARINLLVLSMGDYNVLLLDEPTNNLDIALMESLEKALQNFKGTIVMISHDRYFIDKLATKIFVIKDEKVIKKKGNYSDNFE
ncbi:MAG: ABC-F family ATP-binding cassette domain-containing protein [Nanoarchaeota archaeon]